MESFLSLTKSYTLTASEYKQELSWITSESNNVQLALYNHRFNQPQIKNIGKNPESSTKKNIHLPHATNDLHSICTILGTVNNLETISSIEEDTHRLYTNTMSFYIRNLSNHRFFCPQGSWNQLPSHTEGQWYIWYHSYKTYNGDSGQKCTEKREIKTQRSRKKYPSCIPETYLL